jgi:hypothetical protein
MIHRVKGKNKLLAKCKESKDYLKKKLFLASNTLPILVPQLLPKNMSIKKAKIDSVSIA